MLDHISQKPSTDSLLKLFQGQPRHNLPSISLRHDQAGLGGAQQSCSVVGIRVH